MITSLSLNAGGLGRFGNQCFTLCGAIGVATRSGQQYGFNEWINRDNALFGGQEDKMSDYFVNPLPALPDGVRFQDYPYHWEFRDINLPNGNWNLFNHFQSFKYFEHCRETILHYFRMKDEPKQNDFVAIHYRAGDYTEGNEGYHPRMSKEYYLNAIKKFPIGTRFLIFSDDIVSFKEKILAELFEVINYDYHFKYSGYHSYIDDFKLMKRCKSFIIANSSFSAMAAWLGEHPEKKVISPSWDNWFGKASGINAKDLIHKDWIQVKTW
jgi:hypothetical protein